MMRIAFTLIATLLLATPALRAVDAVGWRGDGSGRFATTIPTRLTPTWRVPLGMSVHLNPREHTTYAWHDWREAARRCFSSSNAEAILLLPRFEPALAERRCGQQP